MIDPANKTYWLIGASEGLGRELAKRLHAAGARLILSARNARRLDSLADALPGSRTLPFDITDGAAVRQAAIDAGAIDGVVLNAATYEPMRSTDWDDDAALRMCETNFIGPMRVLGQVMPDFVERDAGDITLIGSLAGYRGLPASIGYGPSKAAIVSLAETMRHDLRGTGVTVRVVNPGFIDTRLTQKNSFRMPMLMSPEQAARRVERAMRSRRFRTDFPAPFSWAIKGVALLPDLLVYRGK
ncbi:SDR family NAD(P)-dependent oxidoreductase [Actibacterium ureilyticum]|uniref:SDR family NAD(P)-dependent oxidoreductase n=1 Tax=Actibacterium ureilyticum TaxID=1590614 RepID=UPI000BAAF16C|nr:SDR family NAD(P)-dependent oxidoreductase [Actibacterium ureilyticum]